MVEWVNRSLIPAPRNGTVSHTVTFASASAGSLLVCVAEGAVTSSTPAGWTLPSGGAAVNNTGLYVWWKIAAAGESSLTTTHNGSNYPVVFVVYEFPAGSSFVKSASGAGISASGANPNLTGLTGTNLLFGAAAIDPGSNTGLSGTWSAPLVEDVDVDVLRSGTDGYWFGTAYVENSTAASFQPTATIANAPPVTKEALTFAVNVTTTTQPSTGTASGRLAWAGHGTGSTDVAGSTTGGLTWAGTASGATQPRGAAAGVVAWDGSASGATQTAGTANDTLSWSGTADGATQPGGAATSALAWSGAASGVVESDGSATGTIGWDATASGATSHSGTASGAVGWAGAASGHAPGGATGTGSGQLGWAGIASGATNPLSAATGGIGWAGAATGRTQPHGAASGAVAWAGAAAGHTPGVAGASGAATGQLVWAGAAVGVIVASGAASGGLEWAYTSTSVRRDITVTATLDPQRWAATLDPQRWDSTLGKQRWAGRLE